MDRNCLRNAVDDDMDAVPLMLGMVYGSSTLRPYIVRCRIVVAELKVGSKSEGSISYDTSRSSRGGCSVLFGGKKMRSRENCPR